MPTESFKQVKDIVVGVLSSAGGKGPSLRQAIRETWASSSHEGGKNSGGGTEESVFFLVAGPWDDVKDEYEEHKDLLWIDEEEVYDGEKSVLTFKTLSFASIVHNLSEELSLPYKFAFKTDDDSYIHMGNLHKLLIEESHDPEYDYWGWCQRKQFYPLRDEENKWAISYETYPETSFPRYCQGAGFALSRRFLECAGGEGQHIAKARFMPFEDVAMGLIAQRCEVTPTMVEDERMIHMYRTDTSEERNRVNLGKPKIDESKLPPPDMEGRIIQHRIHNERDMKLHHESLYDPDYVRPEWSEDKEDGEEQEEDGEEEEEEEEQGKEAVEDGEDYTDDGDEKIFKEEKLVSKLNKSNLRPQASYNAKEYNPDWFNKSLTGAWANCTEPTNPQRSTDDNHSDERQVIVSCHTIFYRVPTESFKQVKDIVVGVLSSAGGKGPSLRQAIRETWASSSHEGGKNSGGGTEESVFFLVAGPWDDVKDEYEEHKDLLWIDEEEVYDGEKSVLTFKTLSFASIVHNLSEELSLPYKFAFKTDDDSYIHMGNLHKLLIEESHDPEYDYWGWCQRKQFYPLRDEENKWAISYETYPETSFPRYCQGAGFALSRRFLECAGGEGQHIAKARFMPFEDVAMGLIAQRCEVTPTMVEDERMIHMYRTDTSEERNRVNLGKPKIDESKLPPPDMEGRIIQHRIHNERDMKLHHESLYDPDYVRPEWSEDEEEEEEHHQS